MKIELSLKRKNEYLNHALKILANVKILQEYGYFLCNIFNDWIEEVFEEYHGWNISSSFPELMQEIDRAIAKTRGNLAIDYKKGYEIRGRVRLIRRVQRKLSK